MVLVDTGRSVRRRWRQVPSARWVMRLLGVELALLGLAVAGAVLTGGVVTGALPLIVALLLDAAIVGGLLRAFTRQRRWAWWVLLLYALVSLPADVALGRWLAVVAGSVMLAFLLHPDSREWVAAEPDPGRSPGA